MLTQPTQLTSTEARMLALFRALPPEEYPAILGYMEIREERRTPKKPALRLVYAALAKKGARA